jgi:hypothetical protein
MSKKTHLLATVAYQWIMFLFYALPNKHENQVIDFRFDVVIIF